MQETKVLRKILRGGSWIGIPEGLRSAFRSGYIADGRDYDFGFRVMRHTRTRPRVVRGGSWFSPQDLARCAYRDRLFPVSRSVGLGFRVVKKPNA